MYNSFCRRLWGRGDKHQGVLAEMSADAPSVSLLISKIIQIWDERKKVSVEIQKTLCGGINADNLIGSTCFYLKIS